MIEKNDPKGLSSEWLEFGDALDKHLNAESKPNFALALRDALREPKDVNKIAKEYLLDNEDKKNLSELADRWARIISASPDEKLKQAFIKATSENDPVIFRLRAHYLVSPIQGEKKELNKQIKGEMSRLENMKYLMGTDIYNVAKNNWHINALNVVNIYKILKESKTPQEKNTSIKGLAGVELTEYELGQAHVLQVKKPSPASVSQGGLFARRPTTPRTPISETPTAPGPSTPEHKK